MMGGDWDIDLLNESTNAGWDIDHHNETLKLLEEIRWRICRLEERMGIPVENRIIDLLPSEYQSTNGEL